MAMIPYAKHFALQNTYVSSTVQTEQAILFETWNGMWPGREYDSRDSSQRICGTVVCSEVRCFSASIWMAKLMEVLIWK